MLLGGFVVNFTSLVLQCKSSQDKTAVQILLSWVYYSNVDQYSWIRCTSELKFIMLPSVRKRDITDSYLQREPWAMSPQRVITQLYVSRLKEKLLLSNFICSSTLPAHQQTSHKNQKSPAGEHRGAFSSAAARCFWRSDTELRVEWMLNLYFQISRIRLVLLLCVCWMCE